MATTRVGKRKAAGLGIAAATLVLALAAPQGRDLGEPSEKWLNQIQPPVRIMDAIGLRPGMVIGDIGAGRGRFTVWFAERVGPGGKVYANDVDKRALRHLEGRCQQQGFRNVEIIRGTEERTLIPSGALDVAFMINVYRNLEKPVDLVRDILDSLKAEGILAVVENDPAKSGQPSAGMPREDLIRQVEKSGFALVKTEDFLPRDTIYIFRPVRAGRPGS